MQPYLVWIVTHRPKYIHVGWRHYIVSPVHRLPLMTQTLTDHSQRFYDCHMVNLKGEKFKTQSVPPLITGNIHLLNMSYITGFHFLWLLNTGICFEHNITSS